MNNLLSTSKLLLTSQRISGIVACRFYAKQTSTSAIKPATATKKVGKAGPIVEKVVHPVEKDTKKLVNYVCGSNIYVDGEDIKLKPESEYPDWLWNIYTGPPKKLDELDPNTKAYWRKVRKMALRQNNVMAKLKRF